MIAAAHLLRNQLAAGMALVGACGLAGVLVMAQITAAVRETGAEQVLLPEPYQDLLLVGPLALCGAGLMWLVSRRSFRRLSAMSKTVATVGPDQPHSRLSPGDVPGEMRPLVEAVNGALDRLAVAYASEQMLIADTAHQLRTPLTTLSLRLQRARADGGADWQGLQDDVHHLSALIDRLLRLTRLEHRRRGFVPALPDAPVDFGRLLREVAAGLVPLADAGGRTLEVECRQTLLVRARPEDLSDLIANLIENAIRHGAGHVLVVAAAAPDAPFRIRLRVHDEGPGIPPTLGASAFERFRTGGTGAGGSGLGLAIVREIALAYGGTAHLSPDAPHGVEVRLPLVVETAPGQTSTHGP